MMMPMGILYPFFSLEKNNADSDWDEEDEGGDSSSKSTGRPFSQFEEQIMEQIPKLNLEASSDKIRDACSILVRCEFSNAVVMFGGFQNISPLLSTYSRSTTQRTVDKYFQTVPCRKVLADHQRRNRASARSPRAGGSVCCRSSVLPD